MLRIEVNVSHVEKAISRLANAGEMRLNLMRGIGGVLLAAIERGFRDESDPVTGAPWADLSPATIAARARKGHNGKKLQVSGHLAASFGEVSLSESEVVVGSNDVKAPTLHHGAKKGAYGRMSILNSRREVPIPFGDIPGRYMLPIGENGDINPIDEEEIAEVLQNNIKAVFSG